MAGAGAQHANAAACPRIDAEVEKINARMRAKYSNQEGEYFRHRLHELSGQRWDAGCRFL
jgi:hypothetical protein